MRSTSSTTWARPWTWSEDFDLQREFEDLRDELELFGFGEVGEDSNLLLRCCAAILARDASPTAQVALRGADVLRHPFASTMLSRNAPLLYVQQQGGWRSASVLLRVYARWMPQDFGGWAMGQSSATQAQPSPVRLAGGKALNAS